MESSIKNGTSMNEVCCNDRGDAEAEKRAVGSMMTSELQGGFREANDVDVVDYSSEHSAASSIAVNDENHGRKVEVCAAVPAALT